MHDRFSLFLSFLVISTGVRAQPNLLANPGFDTDLTGWEIAFERPAEWNPDDVLSAPDSGSVLLTHEEPIGGGFLTILRQCVPISGPGDFRIGGWVRNLPDQAVPGSASILVAPVRFADCTGGAGNSTGTLAVTSTNWQYNETPFTVSHATVPYQAIEVRLAVLKSEAVDTPRSALFDEIELVSLDLPDLIFESNFEPL